MLSLKSEATEDLISLNTSSELESTKQELDNWTRLVFAFEMDRKSPSSPRNPQRPRSTSSSTNTTGQRQRAHNAGGVSEYDGGNIPSATSRTSIPTDVQDAALLAQFAATAGGSDFDQVYANMLSQNNYPSMSPTSGLYGNFLHHNSMPPPQLPPLSSLDFPWNSIHPQPQIGSNHYDSQYASSSTSLGTLPFMQTQYSPSSSAPPETTRGNSRRAPHAQPQPAEMQAGSSPEVEQGEADNSAISDEKRRRNTAASARFRIKKKHKTISLDRSVTELTGRAEELEREAADLRRENGWLKEIVMLKGTQFAANNQTHRQALSQAAALALGSSTSGSGADSTIQEESGPESSQSELSNEEGKSAAKKGKGKSVSKSKK